MYLQPTKRPCYSHGADAFARETCGVDANSIALSIASRFKREAVALKTRGFGRKSAPHTPGRRRI